MNRPAVEIGGVPRHYEWGSRTAIPELLGLEPDGRPVAELWFGAHEGDPSPAGGTTLAELIAADPRGLLGADCVDRFGAQLPYLLKVLAAERALSIQVHPTREQARAGYAAEEAAGVAQDAPDRNYADPNHKPELLCALTPFEAVCGFRPVAETLALLEEIGITELDFLRELLDEPDGLRKAFTELLTLDEPAALADAVAARSAPDGPLRAPHLAAHDFPGDIGVVLTVLLNYVRLAPGEAIYLGAGNVHAYLGGTGVEIMASSDNVLRCGLTAKHVDVAELLKITDFAELAEPRWPSKDGTFIVPVPDFRMRGLRVTDPLELGGEGAQIVLCTKGALDVDGIDLTPGHAAFVAAGASSTLRGTGQVFVASPG